MLEDIITAALPIAGGLVAYLVGWAVSNAGALVKKTDTKLDDQVWAMFTKAMRDSLAEKDVVAVVEVQAPSNEKMVDPSSPQASNVIGGTV